MCHKIKLSIYKPQKKKISWLSTVNNQFISLLTFERIINTFQVDQKFSTLNFSFSSIIP